MDYGIMASIMAVALLWLTAAAAVASALRTASRYVPAVHHQQCRRHSSLPLFRATPFDDPLVPYPHRVADISEAWDHLAATQQLQPTVDGHQHVYAALPSFNAYVAAEDNHHDLFTAEPDDANVLAVTRDWVQAVIADFAVCPFTVQAGRAGIPRGDVRYTVSRATTLVDAYAGA